MTQAKHTAGPWLVGCDYGRLKTEIYAPNGKRAVAAVWTKRPAKNPDKTGNNGKPTEDDEGRANAALIAAAPDGYEAAKTAMNARMVSASEVAISKGAWTALRDFLAKAAPSNSAEGSE